MTTAEAPIPNSDANSTPTPWRDHFTREELASLIEMHDWRSWLTLALNWGIVFASMAMVAVWTNPFTIVLALFLIGARQLGFAVVMHDASHRAFLSNRAVNDWVGNWLGAYPVWSDLRPYRPYHIQHHSKTGTDEDPDLGLITPFPITRKSLLRKIWRDLSGQTGIKFAKGSFKRTFGRYFEDEGARAAANGVLITNLVLFGILAAAGHPWLYLLWVGAWLTTNTLVTRIRAIAEHALTPQGPREPEGRTRTTIANPLARLFIAPNRVNYHLEHHLMMTVPHYHLPRFHQLLSERGLLSDACLDSSYFTILKRASSKGMDDEYRDDSQRKPVRYPPF